MQRTLFTNPFDTFLQQLSWHDQLRMQEILRDHPELFPVILRNIESKQELLQAGSKEAARQIADKIITVERETMNQFTQQHSSTST